MNNDVKLLGFHTWSIIKIVGRITKKEIKRLLESKKERKAKKSKKVVEVKNVKKMIFTVEE